MQSRYYDPHVKRFINADGYVSTGQGVLGNNMYAYCGNNPVVRADPSGQFWIAALIITGVIAITFSGCDSSYGASTVSPLTKSAVSSPISNSYAPSSPSVTSPVDSADYRNNAPSAAYGAYRNGGRTHKGVDYYPSDSKVNSKYGSDGTPKNVYAMAQGTVVDYMPNFYAGTAAIVVNHGDFYALYGEISTDFRVGHTVSQGQCLGTMAMSWDNTLMLHLEIFKGGYGGYTRNNPYRVDPTYTYNLPDR